MTTGAYDRFPANTVAACFVNDARHPKPSNGVRIGLKLLIGTHDFPFADATSMRAFQADDCYHWPRPSGLNGWAYGDVALVKVMTAANTPATGRAGYTGEYTVEAGNGLVATKGYIADANGTSRADSGEEGYAYTYQWVRVVGGRTEEDIPGENLYYYTAVKADQGNAVRVKVSFRDDLGNAETRTSFSRDVVGGPVIVPLDLADGGKVIWQGTLTPVALDRKRGL